MALPLALLGFGLVMGVTFQYFTTIAKETVPEDVRVYEVLFAVSGALAVAAVVVEPAAGPIILGALTVPLAGFLVWLLAQRRTPDGALIARVGEPMPPLRALDHEGRPVDLADLRGRRVLFKFFRGSW